MQPTAVMVSGGEPRIDDIAARRKAQLEELRRRRAGQGATPSKPGTPRTVSARTGPARTPPPPPGRKQVQVLRAGLGALRSQEEAAARAKAEKLRKHLEFEGRRARQSEQADQQLRAERLAAREREAAEHRREAARAEQAQAQALVFSGASGAERLAGMRAKLRSPEVLRELYVLKEILGPPVSLRQ